MSTRRASGSPERREGVGAIIVAAGRSRRMGGQDKVFAPLLGAPLVSHSVEVLQACPAVDSIILVLAPEALERGRRLVADRGWSKVRDVCAGGARRQDSVRAGLRALPDAEWIVVHDGARPCITNAMVETGLAEARRTGAAAAAVPARDTMKRVGRDMVVAETMPRDEVWAAQTPQVFRRDLLAEAHLRVHEDVTDDAAMVEKMGGAVVLFPGSHANIKVTTREDLPMVEALLRWRAEAPARARR